MDLDEVKRESQREVRERQALAAVDLLLPVAMERVKEKVKVVDLAVVVAVARERERDEETRHKMPSPLSLSVALSSLSPSWFGAKSAPRERGGRRRL